jgi:GT2 family glycosyltransferase
VSELVSILVPVYNCEAWVDAAIGSALAQTWQPLEVIALDDASTDGSWQKLQKWAPRVRLERAARNGGQNVSRNRLTASARGEWLLYLDADDELAPDAVAEKMRCAGGADGVYGSMEVRFQDGARLRRSTRIEATDFPDPLAAAFLWKYPNTSALLFRRAALLEVGGWNEDIRNCTDYDLYFRLLLARKRLVAAARSTTVYRQWSETQAVHENPARRMATRLGVMWRAALALESERRMEREAREAFVNAALAVIRTLYPLAPADALREHARLKSWNRGLTPSPAHFSRGYRAGYRMLGFRGAELLAAATRFARRSPGTDLFAG